MCRKVERTNCQLPHSLWAAGPNELRVKDMTSIGLRNSAVIEAPYRSSSSGATAILLAVGVLSAALTVPGGGGKWTLIVLLGLLSFAIIRRLLYAIHASLLVLLTFSVAYFVPSFRMWPLSLLVPLAIYGVIVRLTPQLRYSVGWIHRGDIDSCTIVLVITTIVVSAFALVGWVILTKPNIAHHLALIPELPVWAYPFIGISFAIFNAAMEEAIFRGVLMESLDSALSAGSWSVGIQAIPFAAFHYLAGFPNGKLGFIMALVYGVMLGTIRRFSKGMLAPFIAHVAADITIFSILACILFQ